MSLDLLIRQMMNPSGEIGQHSLVKIAGLGRSRAFVALYEGGLQFRVGNKMTTLIDATGAGGGNIPVASQLAQGYINKVLEWMNIPQVKTIATTVAEQYVELWTGPNKPQFGVSLILVNYDGSDIREKAMSLFEAVLPGSGDSQGNQKLGFATVLNPPLGYNSVDRGTNGKIKGTFTVEIGKWFLADDLVIHDVDCQFSHEVAMIYSKGVPTGITAPIWAKMTVTFSPRLAVTYNDFRKYFRLGVSSNSTFTTGTGRNGQIPTNGAL